MSSIVKRIALFVALFVLIIFVVFVFNQTVQIVQSARAVNATLGNGVMWARKGCFRPRLPRVPIMTAS
jgi:hypothetical protein